MQILIVMESTGYQTYTHFAQFFFTLKGTEKARFKQLDRVDFVKWGFGWFLLKGSLFDNIYLHDQEILH